MFGQQPRIRLADRGHEFAGAAAEVDRASGVEPNVVEPWAGGQREIDLKAAPPVAVAGRLRPHPGRDAGRGAQQPPVQPVRGRGDNHRLAGVHGLAG